MKLEIITDNLLYEFSDSIKENYRAKELRYIIRFFIGFGYNDCCSYVRNMQSRNRVTLSQLCYGPVVTYCMVYHYTKRATLAKLLANEGPAIYVVYLNRYFVIPP